MKLLLPIELAAAIKSLLPSDVDVVWVDGDGNFEGDARDAEVYFINFYFTFEGYDRVLATVPTLRWQHAPSAGIEHLLTPRFLQSEIVLTNSAGVFAIPIAEFVLAFMLSHAKQLPALKAQQANRDWNRDLADQDATGEVAIQELFEKTVLIVGAGGIGLAIATRANAFGMRVWGSRRRSTPLPGFEKVVGADEWRSLLPHADYVVIATPATPETQGMIDENVLRSMCSSAYLINIARGAVIDETALLTALREGWIAGAGLDTLQTEPLPADSPFWSLPNVFVTPHSSGASPRNIERIVALFFDNLQRYREGLPLQNVVDRQTGY
jgi:phosphoglycerate dehydrogenase-like enzyme